MGIFLRCSIKKPKEWITNSDIGNRQIIFIYSLTNLNLRAMNSKNESKKFRENEDFEFDNKGKRKKKNQLKREKNRWNKNKDWRNLLMEEEEEDYLEKI